MKKSFNTGFFTLIELLVVIAIIAILAAMLMPALQKARDRAKNSTCLSQQKQIANANNMYADDHDSFFPVHVNGSLNTRQYSYLVGPYLGLSKGSKANVLICPMVVKGWKQYPQGNIFMDDQYAGSWLYYRYNSALGILNKFGATHANDRAFKSTQFRKPSILVTVGEVYDTDDLTVSGACTFRWNSAITTCKIGLNNHGQGSNYAYGDGHAGNYLFPEDLRGDAAFTDNFFADGKKF